jgi:hypothetical protein
MLCDEIDALLPPPDDAAAVKGDTGAEVDVTPPPPLGDNIPPGDDAADEVGSKSSDISTS